MQTLKLQNPKQKNSLSIKPGEREGLHKPSAMKYEERAIHPSVSNDNKHNFGDVNLFAGTPSIQAKLSVNTPGDVHEQQADAMAEKVMRMPVAVPQQTKITPVNIIQQKCATCGMEEEKEMSGEEMTEKDTATVQRQLIQRKCADCEKKEEEEKKLQRKETNNAGPAVSSAVNQTLKSSGMPLDAGTRSYMEPRFGFNFSNVQVHNDSLAHQSAKDINALAYTHQNKIVFGAGQYQPDTETGKKLLAHELTHVIQQGSGKSPVKPIIQRAVSKELDKIEDLLSYGILDWAIRDAEAIEALDILKGLPKYQQAVFVADQKYLDRLRDNLPDNRLPELTEIETGVADIIPPSAEIKDIRSNLSYGIFHLVITDKNAVESLEKLKKLSGAQLAVALGTINYSRLLDNLPDDRKQELVDLMAKNLATGGARTTEEEMHPGAIINNISFKSDHGLLNDNKKDWTPGGTVYAEPEWGLGKDNTPITKPISQNKSTNLVAQLNFNISPITAGNAPISIIGESNNSFLQFNYNGTMQGGLNQDIVMSSVGKLPDEVKKFKNEQVKWRMKWQDWDHEIGRTAHDIFVTMNTPLEIEDGSITEKRMEKAVDIISPLGTSPNDIVAGIMKNWNIYSLEVPLHYPIWTFADAIKEGGQCIDIVRFVRALIQMVGCPGTIDAVVIWAQPSAPGVPIESLWGNESMASIPPNEDHNTKEDYWKATLLDGDWHSNNFEAALKFNYGGNLTYYPGGVEGSMATPLEVLNVFKCMAWVKWIGGQKCKIMEVPKDYKYGPCPVGSEHECYVKQ